MATRRFAVCLLLATLAACDEESQPGTSVEPSSQNPEAGEGEGEGPPRVRPPVLGEGEGEGDIGVACPDGQTLVDGRCLPSPGEGEGEGEGEDRCVGLTEWLIRCSPEFGDDARESYPAICNLLVERGDHGSITAESADCITALNPADPEQRYCGDGVECLLNNSPCGDYCMKLDRCGEVSPVGADCFGGCVNRYEDLEFRRHRDCVRQGSCEDLGACEGAGEGEGEGEGEGASPDGGVRVCGGAAERTCGPDEFCEFEDGSCGFHDQPGRCRPQPDRCGLEQPCPVVCGCDGETYCNRCAAAANNVSVFADGACAADGSGPGDFDGCIQTSHPGVTPVAFGADCAVVDFDCPGGEFYQDRCSCGCIVESEAFACETDEDCVPEGCCRPTGCVAATASDCQQDPCCDCEECLPAVVACGCLHGFCHTAWDEAACE